MDDFLSFGILALILGICIGYIGTQEQFEKQAIGRGYAQYNTITKEFEWNNSICQH